MSLKRISLRDFAIVRALELDLDSGFTVLTGETGAGKSILLDALSLLLGERAVSPLLLAGSLTVTTYAVTASRGVVSGLLNFIAYAMDDESAAEAPQTADIIHPQQFTREPKADTKLALEMKPPVFARAG